VTDQPEQDTCGAIGSLDGPLPGSTGRCYRRPHHDPHHRDQNGHEWDAPACGEECAEGHTYAGRCAQARHRFTAAPHDPEDERAATERAVQKAAASKQTEAWLAARTTPDNPAASNNETDQQMREQYAAALWEAAEHNIIAEWICCEPLDPSHELCAQGYAAMRMIRALIIDDPEAYKPAPLADAVMAVRDTELQQARETNQRLNLRCQEAESALATIKRSVGEWEVSERGAYVPLRTLTAIGKAVGRDITNARWLLHYQRVETAEAAITRIRQLADRWGNALAPDRRYAEALHAALDGPADTTPPAGSTAREAPGV
jgi:hypothetical protein